MTEPSDDIRTRYLRAAANDPVRAAELLARDLARGDKRVCREGHSADAAISAAMNVLGVDSTELSTELLTARLEAWQEGRSDMRLDDDSVVLRCPECCSELGGISSSRSGRLACGNCGTLIARSEAYVSVADAEGASICGQGRCGENRMKLKTPSRDELPGPFGEDPDLSPVGEVPAPVRCRIRELERIAAPTSTLWLARDYEKCIVGVIEGDDSIEALYFTDDGRVAWAGTNQPAYVAKVEDLPPF